MIAGSCTSVCAATLGASELYDEMFRDTRDQAKELSPAKDVIEYTGTTDELFEDLIVEERPDAQPNAIDWTIKSMTVEETICFNKNNGDTIKVAGVIEPGNITIQVGLIEPDGYLRYINVKDSFVYVFDLNKNGSYKVYIENLNSATVSVVGGFS